MDIANISFDSLEHVLCMPFYNEYFELVDNSSKLADCTNSMRAYRNASNATAAAFLRQFSKCPDFSHFDIAGTNEFKKFAVNPLVLTLYLFALKNFK